LIGFRKDASKTYSKLHALRSRRSEFPRYDDLTSFRPTFHDESQHTITGSPHSQTIEQFVAERFTLSHSRETTVLDFGGIEGDGVFRELKAFLDERCELADAAPLFAKDFLGVCCADDCTYVKNSGIGTEGRSILISVTVGVTRTSTPEYPSSASSRWKNSFNSA
jgi:hypothetical protein